MENDQTDKQASGQFELLTQKRFLLFLLRSFLVHSMTMFSRIR